MDFADPHRRRIFFELHSGLPRELPGDFALPDAAWWDNYYGPKEKRLADLIAKYAGDPVATGVLRESREELEIHRRYSEYYSYVFLVMKVMPAPTTSIELAPAGIN